MDSFCAVVVGGRNDFDDFVARELKVRDVVGGAGHQVTVEDSQDGFVGDDEEVVLFAFKLENDRLEAHGEVVVRLRTLA